MDDTKEKDKMPGGETALLLSARDRRQFFYAMTDATLLLGFSAESLV